jgi:hypothetical protein
MKKTRSKKSRDTVSLRVLVHIMNFVKVRGLGKLQICLKSCKIPFFLAGVPTDAHKYFLFGRCLEVFIATTVCVHQPSIFKCLVFVYI